MTKAFWPPCRASGTVLASAATKNIASNVSSR
jgi:hypothetical protein